MAVPGWLKAVAVYYVIGPIVLVVAIGVFLLVVLDEGPTKLVVTVTNRTPGTLESGLSGVYYSELRPVDASLRRVAPGATVSHELVGGPDEVVLSYRLPTGKRDTVECGYPEGGGVIHTWVVAEGDSLGRDSVVWTRHGERHRFVFTASVQNTARR